MWSSRKRFALVLTTPLQPDDSVNAHIHRQIPRRGEGVQDIALWVDDAEAAYLETTKRGAKSVRSPEVLRGGHGEWRGLGPTFKPQAIRCVRELPETQSGKIVRRLVRQKVSRGSAGRPLDRGKPARA